MIATINVRKEFGKVADDLAMLERDNPERVGIISFLASSNGSVTVEQLQDAFDAYREKASERAEAEKAKAERKVQREAVEALRGKVTAADSLDSVRSLLSEVEAAGGHVIVTASGFDTTLKAPNRGGGTGQGRPKKDAPTGFVDSAGEPILGSFTAWVKTQIEADSFDAELTAKLLKSDGKTAKGKAPMAKTLLEAGEISAAVAA